MTIKKVLEAAALLGAFAMAAPLLAADYPDHPITLIVPFAPGGNLDMVARLISPPLSQALGQQVIVENHPGAGGAVGAGLIARADPDGYSLLVTTPNAISVLPWMTSVPYKIDSFTSVGLVSSTSLAVVVKSDDTRFKDAAGLIAYAKAHPGELSAGYSGIGTTNHVGLLTLEDAAGIQLNTVPYKGSGPALVDLLGGRLDIVVDQLTSSISNIQAGKLRGLAVMSAERDALLPDLPTLREAGLKDFDASTTTGLLAPANTPKAVIDKIDSALKTALATPQLQSGLLRAGSTAKPSEPQAFSALLQSENKRAEALAAAGKFKVEE